MRVAWKWPTIKVNPHRLSNRICSPFFPNRQLRQPAKWHLGSRLEFVSSVIRSRKPSKTYDCTLWVHLTILSRTSTHRHRQPSIHIQTSNRDKSKPSVRGAYVTKYAGKSVQMHAYKYSIRTSGPARYSRMRSRRVFQMAFRRQRVSCETSFCLAKVIYFAISCSAVPLHGYRKRDRCPSSAVQRWTRGRRLRWRTWRRSFAGARHLKPWTRLMTRWPMARCCWCGGSGGRWAFRTASSPGLRWQVNYTVRVGLQPNSVGRDFTLWRPQLDTAK